MGELTISSSLSQAVPSYIEATPGVHGNGWNILGNFCVRHHIGYISSQLLTTLTTGQCDMRHHADDGSPLLNRGGC